MQIYLYLFLICIIGRIKPVIATMAVDTQNTLTMPKRFSASDTIIVPKIDTTKIASMIFIGFWLVG
jgi:hypothetical protein